MELDKMSLKFDMHSPSIYLLKTQLTRKDFPGIVNTVDVGKDEKINQTSRPRDLTKTVIMGLGDGTAAATTSDTKSHAVKMARMHKVV